jgi:tetratricopeptide (TPR) repeat protein
MLSRDLMFVEELDIQNYIALAYFRLKQYKEALSFFNIIISNLPDNAKNENEILKYLIYKGRCYHGLNQYSNAEAVFCKVESLYPLSKNNAKRFIFLYKLWFGLYMSEKDYIKAKMILDKANNIIDNYHIKLINEIQFRYTFARYYVAIGDEEKAISFLESYLTTLSEDDISHWDSRTMIQYAYLLVWKFYATRLFWEKNKSEIDYLFQVHDGFKKVLKIYQGLYEEMHGEESRFNLIKNIRVEYENLFLSAFYLFHETGDEKYMYEMFRYIEDGKAIRFKDKIRLNDRFSESCISDKIRRLEKEYKLQENRIRFLLNDENINKLSEQ